MENSQSCYDKEHIKLMRVVNFRFPHVYKRIGLIGAVATLVGMTLFKFYGANLVEVKDILRTLILLFLLIACLSKDMVEDEYLNYLRHQSFVIAFVCAIGYALVLPFIVYGLDLLISMLREEGSALFMKVSAFEVMFMLICFQLLVYEALKRFGRAE